MDKLRDVNFVEKILSEIGKSLNVDVNPIKSFFNPLSEARKRKSLPRDGFLAGGAVCNTILSLIDGKKYPINDIDIFVETSARKEGYANRSTKTNVYNAGYNELMSIADRSTSYSIVETEREDLFNWVYINKNGDTHGYQYILEGFDINCCMVGINLSTKELIYTKDFVDFLSHRQLQVVNPYTPCHTSLRLIKKSEELGCYLDIEKEIKYLSQLFLMFDDPYQNGMNTVFGNFFSEKYKDLFHSHENKISQYFELLTFVEAKKKGFLKMNSMIRNKVMDVSEIPQDFINSWTKKDNLFTFYPKKYVKPEHYVNYIPSSCRGPIALKKLWEVFERSGKSDVKKSEMILSNPSTAHFFFAVENFYKCDFNEKNVEEFQKLVGSNQNIINTIIKTKLNLQESINFIKLLKSISNKESILFVDIILERLSEKCGQITKEVLMDREFLKVIFEEEKIKRSSILTEPQDLNDFEYRLNVYELITEYDLMFGSRTLHNCMSNPAQDYAGKIKNKHCKLFLIETDNNYSGLELEYDMMGFKLKTLLGVTNQNPCEKHVFLANYLINYLNHQYWTIRSNEIIDKLNKNMSVLSDKVKGSADNKIMKLGLLNSVNRLMYDYTIPGNINQNDVIGLNNTDVFEQPLPF